MAEKLTLKETILELKSLVFNNLEVENVEKYLADLSERNPLTFDDLSEFYNLMTLWKFKRGDIPKTSYAGKKTWTDAEENIFLFYTEIVQDLPEFYSRKQMFLDLSEIFERTDQALSFKYYQLVGDKSKNAVKGEDKSIINDEISNKAKKTLRLLSEDVYNEIEVSETSSPNNDFDLINAMGQLMSNLETIELDINPFFAGLLAMSEKAVQNNNTDKIQELENKVEFVFKQLNNEKKSYEELQRKVNQSNGYINDLRQEIEEFDKLSSMHKLQQLSEFTSRLKDILNDM